VSASVKYLFTRYKKGTAFKTAPSKNDMTLSNPNRAFAPLRANISNLMG
jgi:hypothetical protein